MDEIFELFLDILLDILPSKTEEIRKFRRSRKISPDLDGLEDFVLTKAKNKEDKIEVLSILTNYGTEKTLALLQKTAAKEKNPDLHAEITKAINELHARLHNRSEQQAPTGKLKLFEERPYPPQSKAINLEQVEEFLLAKSKGKKAKKEILSILANFGTEKTLLVLRKTAATEKDPDLRAEITQSIAIIQKRLQAMS